MLSKCFCCRDSSDKKKINVAPLVDMIQYEHNLKLYKFLIQHKVIINVSIKLKRERILYLISLLLQRWFDNIFNKPILHRYNIINSPKIFNYNNNNNKNTIFYYLKHNNKQ